MAGNWRFKRRALSNGRPEVDNPSTKSPTTQAGPRKRPLREGQDSAPKETIYDEETARYLSGPSQTAAPNGAYLATKSPASWVGLWREGAT